MAHKLRSVNTRFWEDPFVENLTSEEKLIFLYLLTNPLCNILGVYEISTKRISYDTGISKQEINKALKGFETLNKVYYVNNYIVLSNFIKNQKLNTNMEKGAITLFDDLPNDVKDSILSKALKGFESIVKASKHFEKEKEKEKENNEVEKKDISLSDLNNLTKPPKEQKQDPVFDLMYKTILKEQGIERAMYMQKQSNVKNLIEHIKSLCKTPADVDYHKFNIYNYYQYKKKSGEIWQGLTNLVNFKDSAFLNENWTKKFNEIKKVTR